jgi:hypothetical protein
LVNASKPYPALSIAGLLRNSDRRVLRQVVAIMAMLAITIAMGLALWYLRR